MDDVIKDIRKSLRKLTGELDNFQEIAKYLKPPPGETPELKGVDIYGESMPLNGLVGGDHIIYMNFMKRYDLDARIEQAKRDGNTEIAENLIRCKTMAGIVLLDVSGHQITDAMLAGMMHQAFLLGAIYEMDHWGTITERLFENLNTRFYNSSSVSKFITMIYGEISENDTFKFISAAHPMPIVFSKARNKIVEINQDFYKAYPPIGTLPSQDDIDRRTTKSVLGYKKKYRVNTWTLMGSGDILLLHTDGLSEHINGEEEYCPDRLEGVLRKHCDGTSEEIFNAIKSDLLAFNTPSDDISMVVIKRE
jgi:serine phosphatase RsbU (regulator of sigma subunit)